MNKECEHRNIIADGKIKKEICKDCDKQFPCRHITGRTYDGITRICDICDFVEDIINPNKLIPIEGENYFCADVFYPSMANICTYQDNSNFHFRMKHNLLFKTKEEAVARSKELLNQNNNIIKDIRDLMENIKIEIENWEHRKKNTGMKSLWNRLSDIIDKYETNV